MKKLLCNLMLVWCVTLSCYAQNLTVKGKVTDDKGAPLSGVTVTIKSTSRRAATNVDGMYSITVNSANAVLVFTHIGLGAQEIPVNGKSVIDVKLTASVEGLTEVIVTALNIPRNKASLGYAAQSVGVNDLTEARATNITDLLDGKVAGLQLTTSGQSTGSTKIQLRGPGSISNNNQPLWVVDGVPIDNNDSNGQVGDLDYGNNAADLNPDDIESIVVLKGPNAAALYGSKAANGAILVTTKKGKKNGGFGISYNGNYMATHIMQSPDLQFVFGEGSNGNMSGTFVGPLGQGVLQAGTGGGRNWGGLLLGQPYLSTSGQPITYSPQPNVLNNFFQVAGASTQNISLSDATDNSAIRFSFTRLDANDIVLNQNQVQKNNFQLNASHDFATWVRIESRIQYIQETVTNRMYRNEDPLNPFNYFNQAVLSIPLASLIPWKDANGNEFNSGGSNNNYDNPYWVIHEDSNQDTHNTILGGVTATFKLTKGLQFRAQESADLLWGNRYTFVQKGSLSNQNGSYNEFQQNNQVWNTEGLFMYNAHISDFSIVANLGGNLRNTNYYNTSAGTSQLAVQNVMALSNTTSILSASESFLKSQVQSAYGTASVGYKDFIYLELTDRSDWSSTLPVKNSPFNYPSASGSFVFTELWKDIPKEILSFGKIRASVAQVGNDPSPYNLVNSFSNSTGATYNGVSLLSFDQQLKSANLKPEITTSTEIGAELHFLNERLSLDASVYKSESKNQFLTGNVPPESGFSTEIINAGEIQNKGLEVTLSGTPVKTRNFSWDAIYNFSMNRNLVVSLLPGLTSFRLGGTNTASTFAVVGKPLGELEGQDEDKSSSGLNIINPANGLPYYTTVNPILGNAQPKALMSFGSTFRYKAFSFNFLLTSRIGGSIYSGTAQKYFTSGAAAQTLQGRDAWLFSNGVLGESGNEQKGITTLYNLPYPDASRVKGSLFPGYYPVLGANGQPVLDANGNMVADLTKPNTYYLLPQTYWQQTGHLTHFFIYDATFVKLSQVIATYTFPQSFLRKTIFKSGSLSLVGRNLWLIYQRTPRGIDPESAQNAGNAVGLEDAGSVPYASYGVDLKVSL
jgi:TonB-linked SusC/RagA family outer membrane protein